MKKLLFIITFIPMFVLLLICLTLYGVGSKMIDAIHWYEGWCFGYKGKGWRHLGHGIWRDDA